ncbi:MAG: carotenoid 1,2-hydratase [Candidatus Tectomicrobia bacterium]|nr:carotenoid 1,2-hydratase [Candidatus Tectomicrobia bacterium]
MAFVRRTLLIALVIIAAALALAAYAAVDRFELALPGKVFSFPEDHASHPSFQTEWWYHTGHLKTKEGRSFGFEITFFRRRTDSGALSTDPSSWSAKHLYLAHFAVTDETARRFRYAEKINRPGLGVAGADELRYHVWNEDWLVERLGGVFHLKASMEGYAVNLILTPEKPPVIHGVPGEGMHRKGPGKGNASHYYSMTRLRTEGFLTLEGRALEVSGHTWMDHEFGSNQLRPEVAGWDWFSMQLDDGTDLMVYHLRRKDGGIDPYSTGSVVGADGSSRHLPFGSFTIAATGSWTSPQSAARYPMGWRVEVPSEKLAVTLEPALEDQELVTKASTRVTYWEGSVRIRGTKAGKPISGLGYVEMVGYAKPIEL